MVRIKAEKVGDRHVCGPCRPSERGLGIALCVIKMNFHLKWRAEFSAAFLSVHRKKC